MFWKGFLVGFSLLAFYTLIYVFFLKKNTVYKHSKAQILIAPNNSGRTSQGGGKMGAILLFITPDSYLVVRKPLTVSVLGASESKDGS